jgi:hypothetical protein
MYTTRPNNPQPPDRRDRLIQERIHDPYQTRLKLSEPTVCGECGAFYHDGRWQWGEAPAGGAIETCPACRRVQDRCPAGFLTLGGPFFAAHREEILSLVHNVEAREKSRHALKRLMAAEEQEEGRVLVTFTDPDLARAAGEAIEDAYRGNLDFTYQEDEYLLRVTWTR